MADSSDEEYRKRYEKYAEREMQKVGKKNSISPLEALKKKKLTPVSDDSDDEKESRSSEARKKSRGKKLADDSDDEKQSRSSDPRKKSRGKKLADNSDEEKVPKKRGRPPKSTAKPKAAKAKEFPSDSESDIEPVKKAKKSDKKIRPKAAIQSDDSDVEAHGSVLSKEMYFDWSPEHKQVKDVKPVARFDQHLGFGNYLSVCSYKNRNQIHFRKYVDGHPTKNGINLPLSFLEKIKGTVEVAETHARACGALACEEPKKKKK